MISGHGNDNHGCGEFCATEHRFALDGGAAHVKRQLLAATDAATGCAETVDAGTTPSEFGTWLYGRDGWCNGRDVIPWVVDVSADVLRGGANTSATLTYDALWCSAVGNCSAPSPGPPSTWSQAAPVAMVSVYVVLS